MISLGKYLVSYQALFLNLFFLCFFIGVTLYIWSDYCFNSKGSSDVFNVCSESDRENLETSKVAFFTLSSFFIFLTVCGYIVSNKHLFNIEQIY